VEADERGSKDRKGPTEKLMEDHCILPAYLVSSGIQWTANYLDRQLLPTYQTHSMFTCLPNVEQRKEVRERELITRSQHSSQHKSISWKR
jgi:hypothetical protein